MRAWRRWLVRTALLLWSCLAPAALAAWLASASPVLAARQVVRLADAAQDPRLLVVAALLLLAAWLGVAGGWRRGQRYR